MDRGATFLVVTLGLGIAGAITGCATGAHSPDASSSPGAALANDLAAHAAHAANDLAAKPGRALYCQRRPGRAIDDVYGEGPPGGVLETVIHADRSIEEWHDAGGGSAPVRIGSGILPRRFVDEAFPGEPAFDGAARVERSDGTGTTPVNDAPVAHSFDEVMEAARSFVQYEAERSDVPVPTWAMAEIEVLADSHPIEGGGDGRANSFHEALDRVESERGRGDLIDLCRAGLRSPDETVARACASRLDWNEVDSWESGRIVSLAFDDFASPTTRFDFEALRSMIGSRELAACYRFFPGPPWKGDKPTHFIGNLHRQSRLSDVEALLELTQHANEEIVDGAWDNIGTILDNVGEAGWFQRIGVIDYDKGVVADWTDTNASRPVFHELLEYWLEPPLARPDHVIDDPDEWQAEKAAKQAREIGAWDRAWFDRWEFGPEDALLLCRLADRFRMEQRWWILAAVARAMRGLEDTRTAAALVRIEEGARGRDAGLVATAALAERGDRRAAEDLARTAAASINGAAAQMEQDGWVDGTALALWLEHDPRTALGAFADAIIAIDATNAESGLALLDLIDRAIASRIEHRLQWSDAAFRCFEARIAASRIDAVLALSIATFVPWCNTRRLVEAGSVELRQIARGESESALLRAMLERDEFGRKGIRDALALVEAFDADLLTHTLREFASLEDPVLRRMGRVALLRLGDERSGASLLRWLESIDFDLEAEETGIEGVHLDGWLDDDTPLTALAASATPGSLVAEYLLQRARAVIEPLGSAASLANEEPVEWDVGLQARLWEGFNAVVALAVMQGVPYRLAYDLPRHRDMLRGTQVVAPAAVLGESLDACRRIIAGNAMDALERELERQIAIPVEYTRHLSEGLLRLGHPVVRRFLERMRVEREYKLYAEATALLASIGDVGARRETEAALRAGRYRWMDENFSVSELCLLGDDVQGTVPFWIEELQSSCCRATIPENLFRNRFGVRIDEYSSGGESVYEQVRRWWQRNREARFVRVKLKGWHDAPYVPLLP